MAFFPVIEDINVSDERKMGRDFAFENGGHILNADGTLREWSERESIENWIRKVLSTCKGAYEVYVKDEGDSFGTSIYEYIGTKNRGYKLSEIKREIKEQLLKNKFIEDVYGFTIETEKRKTIIRFNVRTTEGIIIQEEVEV